MKKAQIKISYIVYPPDYVPGVHKYEHVRFLKKAKNKALHIGSGAVIYRDFRVLRRDGSGSFWMEFWGEVK